MPLVLRDVTEEERTQLKEKKRKFDLLDRFFNHTPDPETVSLERELDEIIYDLTNRIRNIVIVHKGSEYDPRKIAIEVIENEMSFHPRLQVEHRTTGNQSNIRYDNDGSIEVIDPEDYFAFTLRDMERPDMRIRKCVTMEFILGRAGALPPVSRYDREFMGKWKF